MIRSLMTDTIMIYGRKIPARLVQDTWLYIRTDYYMGRGCIFWLPRDDSYYRVEEESLTTNGGYQKFKVAKLPNTL